MSLARLFLLFLWLQGAGGVVFAFQYIVVAGGVPMVTDTLAGLRSCQGNTQLFDHVLYY